MESLGFPLRAEASLSTLTADVVKSSAIEGQALNPDEVQRGDVDITRWLEWFLECLDRAIDGADVSLSGVLHKAKLWERVNRRPVNDRQRTVINRMLNGFEGFLTNSKYAKLARCSPDTALRDIQVLVERGILVKNPGRGRSTSYRLADPDAISD